VRRRRMVEKGEEVEKEVERGMRWVEKEVGEEEHMCFVSW
jgi:hypothetical protein